MSIPRVVIVGRPNVGKSSIFNWLTGRRIAIVDPTAGVTRDRLGQVLEIDDRHVELVDTGGMGVVDVDDLSDHIEQQINMAVYSADVILFVVDVRSGEVALDEEVVHRLRRIEVPILCVVNKCDTDHLEGMADEFHKFGWGVIPVSAKQKRHRSSLLQEIYDRLPAPSAEEEHADEDPTMKVAIVGRRNVGKSTFINTLAQQERVIVSEVPGTTRDSIDVHFEMDNRQFLAIDTPGFRKRKSLDGNLEFYSTHRAERSIRRADVVLMFFDSHQRISKVDKQLVSYIDEQYKPCIFVVNKWDLMAEHMPTERWADYVRDTFGSMWHAPIAFTTGMEGRNVKRVVNHAQMLFKQSLSRISTSKLNQLITAAMDYNPPPLFHHHRPKIYYATQVGVQPPTFVLFCNNPKAFPRTYQRFLLGVLRDELDFGEVPLKLYFRRRDKEDMKDEIDRRRKG